MLLQCQHGIDNHRDIIYMEELLGDILPHAAAHAACQKYNCIHKNQSSDILKLKFPYSLQCLPIRPRLSKQQSSPQHKPFDSHRRKLLDLVRPTGTVPVQLEIHLILHGQQFLNLLPHIRQEHLPCIAGIHRHYQNAFHNAQHLMDSFEAGTRIDGYAGYEPSIDDFLQSRRRMVLCLRVYV